MPTKEVSHYIFTVIWFCIVLILFAPTRRGGSKISVQFSLDNLFEARFFSTRRGGLGKEKNNSNC
jgi:hypothetical protein